MVCSVGEAIFLLIREMTNFIVSTYKINDVSKKYSNDTVNVVIYWDQPFKLQPVWADTVDILNWILFLLFSVKIW